MDEPTNPNEHDQTALTKATNLRDAGDHNRAEAMLAAEMADPGARHSIQEMVEMLSMRSLLARDMGQERRARQLVSEAQSLEPGHPILNDRIRATELSLAVNDTDLEALETIADTVDGLPRFPVETDIELYSSKTFPLMAAGNFGGARAVAVDSYLAARRFHCHEQAVRLTYLQALVELTESGNAAALPLLDQAVWLIEERGASVFTESITNLLRFLAQLESGRFSAAQDTIARLEEIHKSHPSAFLDSEMAHMTAKLALHSGDLEAAGAALRGWRTAAVESGNPQDAGMYFTMQSEYLRRSRRLEEAIAASDRAMRWLEDCPNVTVVREAILDSVYTSVAAADFERAGRWRVDSNCPANAAFERLAEAVRNADPEQHLSAAERLTELGFGYEGLRARLRAGEMTGTFDADLVTDAEASGASWIASRAGMVMSAGHGLPITNREAEVLHLVALGLNNQEIADILFVSRRTITTHVSHILQKLRVRNRTEAGALWHRVSGS